MAMMSGHRKLLEQLRADGVTTMFGDPGSSEEGLLDEVSRFPAIQPILGLQEAALVLMVEVAEEIEATPAQVALAWPLSRDVTAIPATRITERLEENWASQRYHFANGTLGPS